MKRLQTKTDTRSQPSISSTGPGSRLPTEVIKPAEETTAQSPALFTFVCGACQHCGRRGNCRKT